MTIRLTRDRDDPGCQAVWAAGWEAPGGGPPPRRLHATDFLVLEDDAGPVGVVGWVDARTVRPDQAEAIAVAQTWCLVPRARTWRILCRLWRAAEAELARQGFAGYAVPIPVDRPRWATLAQRKGGRLLYEEFQGNRWYVRALARGQGVAGDA